MFENLIQNLIGEQATEQLSKRTGMDPQAAKSVINAVLPVIMKSIGNKTQDLDNTKKLLEAANDHNEESIDDVDEEDGAKVANHLVWNTDVISNQVAEKLWVDSSQVSKIISNIAPLVLSQLNKGQKDGTITSDNISWEASATSDLFASDWFIMKTATAMLDSNKDWSIIDDLLKKWMDLFGSNSK